MKFQRHLKKVHYALLLFGIYGINVLEGIYKYLWRMKIVIKILIVFLLLALFLFQCWETIKKYTVKKNRWLLWLLVVFLPGLSDRSCF